jgi:uncharacterized protein
VVTFGVVAVSILVVAMASCSQTISGFGFTLVSVPLLAIVMPPLQAVSLTVLISTPLAIIRSRREWKDVAWPSAKRLGLASLIGMPIGIAITSHLPDRPLRLIIGIAVAIAGVVLATGFRVRSESPLVDVLAGFVSGVLATTTGTNGPPLVIAMHSRRVAPVVFRATLVVIYLFANVVSLGLFWYYSRLNANAVKLTGITFVPMLLGNAAGTWLVPKVNDRLFHRLILGLLFLSAGSAIYGALR